MSKTKLTFIVQGRIPEDDEDSMSIIKAHSLRAACRQFGDELHDGCSHSKTERAAIRRLHGTDTYITNVALVEGSARIVWYDGAELKAERKAASSGAATG